jgi:hypothetical protein
MVELHRIGLLPGRALDAIGGRRLEYRPRGEEYEITLLPSEETPSGVREGVFGDFLLDRSLFADLERDSGVPVALID